MMTWWPYARLAAAALALAAILGQLVLTVRNALVAETEWGSHLPTVVSNFFSFFTILSNAASVVVLTIAGAWGLRNRNNAATEPRWLANLLTCVSTYMIITGIVYNVLLRGIELPQGATLWWSNELLHVVVPAFLLADVLFAPRRHALPWSSVLIVAAFPVVWAAYTLLRAELITSPATGNAWWYPYPFLDPRVVGSYLGVAGYIVGIAAAIVGVGALVVWVGRRRARSDQ